MITSKSLHHSNITLLFDRTTIQVPDNALLSSLYNQEKSKGAQFVDDPLIHSKLLTLPAINLRVIWENGRLRIEDESQNEPEKSTLAKETTYIYEKLFGKQKLLGYGFNYDIFYRYNNVIGMERIFTHFFGKEILEHADLRDIGVQFTLEKKNKNITEVWFLKITAPLEVAVHINRHFAENELPKQDKLHILFENCYTEADNVMKNFMTGK